MVRMYRWFILRPMNYFFRSAGVSRSSILICFVAIWTLALVHLHARDSELTRVGGTLTRGYAQALAVSGDYLYLAGEAGLQVFDRTTRPVPTLVGGFYTNAFQGFQDIAISGARAYVLDQAAGLYVFDLMDPVRPLLLGKYASLGLMWSLAVQGHYVYVADFFTVLILDMIDPAKPTLVGSYSEADLEAVGITVAGQTAFVSTYSKGFFLLDVSNPQRPVRVGSFDSGNTFNRLTVLNDLVFVPAGSNGLQIVDVSNRSKPCSGTMTMHCGSP